jgi:TolB protein
VITPVPEPTATPIPLIVPAGNVTATPTPTPRRDIGPGTLDEFRGKILFLSDRGGSAQTWVMDPASGEVLALVTDDRVHALARERLLDTSSDGNRSAYVDLDGNRNLQIFVEDSQYGTRKQVTNLIDCCGGETTSYDPSWSPTEEKIAFVSTASGGDEIYVLDLAKQDPVRLTFNSWEWDKHPTWSPDGTQMAFFSNRESGRTQIWLMDADGSNQRNLSNNAYNDWDPIWVR